MISASVGGVALDRMGAMNQAASTIRDDYLPSGRAVTTLALAVTEVRRLEARFLLDDGQGNSRQQVLSAVDAVDRARNAYEPMIDPGPERDRYIVVFDRVWPQVRAEALSLTAAGNAPDIQARIALFTARRLRMS